MWNLTASAYFNRRRMMPKTSSVHDTEIKVIIHAVRDHAGRTTAETSRQLELNSAAQVASVTMVNKWRGWTVETLKESGAMSKYAQQLVSSVPPQDTVKHWTQARWTESGASTTTRLHKSMPSPSNHGQGVGLCRRAWTVVIVVPNQRQTTSLVSAVPFTARLRRSMT